VRSVALVRERAKMARLVARGAVLANYQHNPYRPSSLAQVVKNVRSWINKRRLRKVQRSGGAKLR
jgi:hypothetical protein